MTNPYPLPRFIRQTDVLVGDGGDTYGPFDDFKIWDVLDVAVFARADGEAGFSPVAATVAKLDAAEAYDFFTVQFSDAVPATTQFVVGSFRTHERADGVIAGTRVSPTALEKELSKQGTVLQELRRDVDRGWKSDFGQPGMTMDANVADGDVLMKDGNRLVKGPNAALIAGAQGYAEAAAASAQVAEDAAALFPDPAAGDDGKVVTYNETAGVYEMRPAIGEGSVTVTALNASLAAAFANRAAATAAIVPAAQIVITIAGHHVSGDCPPVSYVEVANSGPLEIDQLQTNGGARRWQIVAGEIDVRHVGMIPWDMAAAAANAAVLQALINRKRAVLIPAETFFVDGTTRLIGGTYMRGIMPIGVTWTSATDGVIEDYSGQSRLVYIGTHTACFDSAPGQNLNHGGISNLAIMAPDTANIQKLFDVHGMLGWTFSHVRMENNAGANAGGFYADQVGSDPTWLNAFLNVKIRIPDASTARTFSAPWSDSWLIGCAFTGGGGAYYYGPGNMSVIGGIYDRAAVGAAAWVVDKLTESATAIRFISVDIDVNNTYGIVISAANSPGGTFFGVHIIGCHFRNISTATADIIFVDHATTKMIGPQVTGTEHSVSGPALVTINYARWDALIGDLQGPTGSPRATFTSTVAAGSGAITSATGTVRYRRRGRELTVDITITITNNGTGAGYVTCTIPFAAAGASILSGRADSVSGKMLQGKTAGTLVQIYNYDNSYPATSGEVLRLSGVIELAA